MTVTDWYRNPEQMKMNYPEYHDDDCTCWDCSLASYFAEQD